jgi:hypothetical protein
MCGAIPTYENIKYPAWREILCWHHNIQISQDKVMESICVPNFTVKTSSALGTTLLKWQIITTSELSDVGLKEFTVPLLEESKKFSVCSVALSHLK